MAGHMWTPEHTAQPCGSSRVAELRNEVKERGADGSCYWGNSLWEGWGTWTCVFPVSVTLNDSNKTVWFFASLFSFPLI